MKKIKKFDDFSKLNEGALQDYQKAVYLLQKVAKTDDNGELMVCNTDQKIVAKEINTFLKNIL